MHAKTHGIKKINRIRNISQSKDDESSKIAVDVNGRLEDREEEEGWMPTCKTGSLTSHSGCAYLTVQPSRSYFRACHVLIESTMMIRSDIVIVS